MKPPNPPLTPVQEDALVAAVGFPADSPAQGAILLRTTPDQRRALTRDELSDLEQRGWIAKYRRLLDTGDIYNAILNEVGVEVAVSLARSRKPGWEPEGPQYRQVNSPDAIDWRTAR